MALTPLRATDPPSYGPYELHGRLGAGGMGVVYLAFGPDDAAETDAESQSDGTRVGSGHTAVALKVLQPALAQDGEYRQRFIREVRAAASVTSPYVARVVASETESESLWLATEYIEGATLAHAVETNGPIPEGRLRGLAADLASAMAALHEAGLVHRDMKPQNVVLAWSGPKLIDFGIAKHEGSNELTQAGMAVGSPLWMSPEVLSGGDAARASDIFGWGMCIAFAGTGRPPFGSGHPSLVAARIGGSEPDLDGLPDGVAELVTAALAKDVAGRPTAEQLTTALGHATTVRSKAVAVPRTEGGWTGPPAAATTLTVPPSGPSDAGSTSVSAEKSPDRKRWAIVLGALAALLIAAGIVVGILLTKGDGKGSGGGVTPSSAASGTVTASPTLASLSQAEAVVAADGYEADVDAAAATWDPQAPINVILASKTGSANSNSDGQGNWAFFFVGNTYIGHDAQNPSMSITVASRTKTSITLAYQLYAPKDPVCCPTAKIQTVTFQYLKGVFKVIGSIPGTDPTKDHR